MNIADEIKKLHELLQADAISEEEFARAKATILSSANSTSDKLVAEQSSNTAKEDACFTSEQFIGRWEDCETKVIMLMLPNGQFSTTNFGKRIGDNDNELKDSKFMCWLFNDINATGFWTLEENNLKLEMRIKTNSIIKKLVFKALKMDNDFDKHILPIQSIDNTKIVFDSVNWTRLGDV